MNPNVEAKSAVSVFPGVAREDYSKLPQDDRLAAEEIERIGFTVLPGLLSPEECDRMRKATSRVYQEEVAEFGGAEAMEAIGDVGVARSPFLRDPSFLIPLAHPKIISIARYFLGQAAQVNLQRVVISAPAKFHAAAIWHRDFSYQDFTTSKPVALTAMAMLDGSNPKNGGPLVLPGSNRFERFPSDEFVQRNAAPLLCEPGAIVLMDSACFHRGGSNVGTELRHSVVTIYTVPVIRQNVDYPRLLDGRYDDDPELRVLLGYNTKMPASDLEYRVEKLKKSKKIAM
jgi:ectoine hydroxylase-related dioxygenase (phytanoyl-CoA dioxygenase family)